MTGSASTWPESDWDIGKERLAELLRETEAERYNVSQRRKVQRR